MVVFSLLKSVTGECEIPYLCASLAPAWLRDRIYFYYELRMINTVVKYKIKVQFIFIYIFRLAETQISHFLSYVIATDSENGDQW